MKPWAWVAMGGLFEVGFTTCLKLAEHNALWNLPFLACAIISFECLARGIRSLPIGLAYAVWTGIGSVGAFAVGILAFGDSRDPVRIALVCALVAALVALKASAGASDPAPPPRPPAR